MTGSREVKKSRIENACVSGKNGYQTEELSIEALIQNHIRNSHREGAGPVNVYECRDCGNWHFTSSGEISPVLKDKEILSRIKREQKFLDWEKNF